MEVMEKGKRKGDLIVGVSYLALEDLKTE